MREQFPELLLYLKKVPVPYIIQSFQNVECYYQNGNAVTNQKGECVMTKLVNVEDLSGESHDLNGKRHYHHDQVSEYHDQKGECSMIRAQKM